VEDWAEARRLHRAEGMGIKAIARRLGLARNTVREALRSDEPPQYERERRGSALDPFVPAVKELLKEFPTMPASVIAERVGWARSIRLLQMKVAELRPLYLPPDPCQRTYYRPGELAQFDLWQPAAPVPLGYDQAAKLWVVVGVCGFSRFMGAWMVPSREAHDVLGGHLQVVRQFGAVPRVAVWDQEACIGRWRGGVMSFTAEFQAFRGALGMGARLCARGDPEAKGLVERANGYLETSFLPGRHFADMADFNHQLSSWLVKANFRVHATTRARPREAMAEERGAMAPLPAALPDTSWRYATRLARDHYVRAFSNDYSVDPRFVGRRIEVRVGLDEVLVTCEGTEVARHRRCLASHRVLLAPEHARALINMRAEAKAVAALAHAVQEPDLSVYDLLGAR